MGTLIEDSYLATYRPLVSFCSKNKPFTAESLFQAMLMTYGWMPTTYKLKGDVEQSLTAINRLIANPALDVNLIEAARKAVNNSVVGLSKLLHFSLPDVWPIWDSRIAENLYGIMYSSGVNRPARYVDYVQQVKAFLDSEYLPKMKTYAADNISYPVSDVRAVEYYLFCGQEIPKV